MDPAARYGARPMPGNHRLRMQENHRANRRSRHLEKSKTTRSASDSNREDRRGTVKVRVGSRDERRLKTCSISERESGRNVGYPVGEGRSFG